MPRQDQTSVKNAENVPITRQMLTLLENDLAKYGLGGATGATALGFGIKKGRDTAKLVAGGKKLIGEIEPKIRPGKFAPLSDTRYQKELSVDPNSRPNETGQTELQLKPVEKSAPTTWNRGRRKVAVS